MSLRGAYIIATTLVSAFIAWKWGALLEGALSVFSGMIAVFAILAGVLVAVISIIGDPSMLMPGNWRVGFEHAKDIQERISRFAHLFTLYLISIFLSLLAQFITDNKIENLDFVFDALMFFSVLSILLSIPLPYSLMSIQKDRMDEEIRRRKGKNHLGEQ